METGKVIGEDGLLHCTSCGERVEIEIDFPLLDGSKRSEKRKVRCMCRCEREEKQAKDERFAQEEEMRRIDELRRLSLMDAKSKEVTFKSYKVTKENEKLFGIAKRYVENFETMYKKSQGLMFWGSPGNGKSYTAAAIANELIERKTTVIMTSFIKLIEEMGRFGSDESEYMDRLNRARLLIIDDFGAERSTDFALEKVYNIIDSRYRSGKPLIITTNTELAHMKNCDDIRYSRIYDRIFEMCYPVKVNDFSWRKRDAADRYAEMKKLLEG